MTKNLPIGVDNFKELVDPNSQFLFVDKTKFIADIIDDKSKSILITRPRRWGKTMNFSMLQHFFAAEVNRKATQGLFQGLHIESMQNGDYMKYQGQYPVIFLTFKELKVPSYASMIEAIRTLIRDLADEHDYLMNSEKISDTLKKSLSHLTDAAVSAVTLSQTLKILSKCLHKHTGQSVYIMIDEYDAPIMHAYECDQMKKTTGFLEEISSFMRNFLSAGLKGNPFLEKGIMSGVLRISYNEMLSGLNNLEVYGVLHDQTYSDSYGFTENEVNDFFVRSGQYPSPTTLDAAMAEAKHYYNGYEINGVTLYNPWSIVSYVKHGQARPYWVNTGNDALIKRHIIEGGDAVQQDFSDLMEGKYLTRTITPFLRFDQLEPGQDGLWTVLLYAGYLKARHSELNGLVIDCDLVIPNQEILHLYQGVFKQWMTDTYSDKTYRHLMQALGTADIDSFIQQLNDYLSISGSVRDFYQEGHYHTFVLGLACGMMHTHYVLSNRESGWGYVDMIIIPKKNENPLAVIVEFKHVKDKTTDSIEALKKAAAQGLEQITLNRYHSILKSYPYIKEVAKVGIAFCGKQADARYQRVNVTTNPAQ